jgi:hypothetical protein
MAKKPEPSPEPLAYTSIKSGSKKGASYRVELYLTCTCEGFKNTGNCKHTRQAMSSSTEWTVDERKVQ